MIRTCDVTLDTPTSITGVGNGDADPRVVGHSCCLQEWRLLISLLSSGYRAPVAILLVSPAPPKVDTL